MAAITNAIGDGTTITYTVSNNLQIGETVTIIGMDPVGYNATNAIVTAATSTDFSIAGTEVGAFVAGGTVDRIYTAAGSANSPITVTLENEDFTFFSDTGQTGYTTTGTIVALNEQLASQIPLTNISVTIPDVENNQIPTIINEGVIVQLNQHLASSIPLTNVMKTIGVGEGDTSGYYQPSGTTSSVEIVIE